MVKTLLQQPGIPIFGIVTATYQSNRGMDGRMPPGPSRFSFAFRRSSMDARAETPSSNLVYDSQSSFCALVFALFLLFGKERKKEMVA